MLSALCLTLETITYFSPKLGCILQSEPGLETPGARSNALHVPLLCSQDLYGPPHYESYKLYF